MNKSNSHRIFIVGMSASGKSTIGKILSKRLGIKWVDMDEVIEDTEGISINKIFEQQGETYFRERERELLLRLSDQKDLVISTGGGAPIYQDAMDVMLDTGRVVWLKVSKANIYSRLSNDASRPVTNTISKTELSKLISSRNETYQRAEIKVWNRGAVDQVVDRIVKAIQQ